MSPPKTMHHTSFCFLRAVQMTICMQHEARICWITSADHFC